MYNNFFGFKERPFQLVPNPEYLFLSRSHEEAIAHLNYAISHGDGFVEISGEVGTGKTTLCRAFLGGLDDSTEVAYIFNPRLKPLELLRAINDEFGIDSSADNTKELIDTLNTFLLERKSQGKNTILLVDEAQNLDADVLEQLRLLSNLETNTSKLLQIILVGQPELRKMLDSFELRQLRQRITLSWYLTPLSRKETRNYIRHRVNIASNKNEDKFTEPAYRMIYNYSGGIPRLINIACDRALLTAFGFNRRKVTGSICRASIDELKARGERPRVLLTARSILTGFAGILLIAVVAAFIFKYPPSLFKPGIVDERNNIPVSGGNPTGNSENIQNIQKNNVSFREYLGKLDNHSSRQMAVKNALLQWKAEPVLNRYLDGVDSDGEFFQLACAQNNFHTLELDNELDLIYRLNLPCVVALTPPGSTEPRYLTIIKIIGGEIHFKSGETGKNEKNEKNVTVGLDEFKTYWNGKAYVVWKDFLNFRGTIPTDTPKESVFTLKMLLREIGFPQLELNNEYDDATREIVVSLQQEHSIKVDGIVGAQTKIVMYNLKKDLYIPHIRN